MTGSPTTHVATATMAGPSLATRTKAVVTETTTGPSLAMTARREVVTARREVVTARTGLLGGTNRAVMNAD